MIRVGPSASDYGADEDESEVWDYKGKSQVVQIFISHDNHINSIQFSYADDNGNLILSEVHGRQTRIAKKFNVVTFDYPSEFLTWVSGDYSFFMSSYRVLATITFGTNKGKYGPYGGPGDGDLEFDYQFGPSFGGFHFHGSSKKLYPLIFIGIYIKPIASLNDMNKNVSTQQVKKEIVDDR